VAGRRSALTTSGGKGLVAVLGLMASCLAVAAPMQLLATLLATTSLVVVVAELLAIQGPPLSAISGHGVSCWDLLCCCLCCCLVLLVPGCEGRLGLVRGTTCRVATSQVCGAKYAALTLTRRMSVCLTEAAVLGTIS
jgi:hypothetical protein